MRTNVKPVVANCALPSSRPRTLREVVTIYRRDHRAALEEPESYRVQRSIEDTVRAAALSRNGNGKKYSHQWRIPQRVLQQAAAALSRAAGALKRSRDFDELINIVDKEAGSISGIGDLAVYDFALRIGARLGRLPERVYLHAGTREGAKALGLNVRGRVSVEMQELPQALRVLKPWEAEDVLCIFKDDFAALANQQTLNSPNSGWVRSCRSGSVRTRQGRTC